MLSWRRFSVILGLVLAGLICLALVTDQIILPAVVNASDIIAVPNVAGMDITRAREHLSSIGLVVMEPREQFTDKVPKGKVMSQLPYSGAYVKEGRRIYLTVSKGIQTMPMPSIVGMSVRDARLKLMRLGLQIGDIAYEYSDSVQAQRILAQAVPAGADVPGGATMSIVVSQGTRNVRVPDLMGMPLAAATAVLEQNGLLLGKVTYVQNGTFDRDVVSAQMPPADSSVAPATPVNISVVR